MLCLKALCCTNTVTTVGHVYVSLYWGFKSQGFAEPLQEVPVLWSSPFVCVCVCVGLCYRCVCPNISTASNHRRDKGGPDWEQTYRWSEFIMLNILKIIYGGCSASGFVAMCLHLIYIYIYYRSGHVNVLMLHWGFNWLTQHEAQWLWTHRQTVAEGRTPSCDSTNDSICDDAVAELVRQPFINRGVSGWLPGLGGKSPLAARCVYNLDKRICLNINHKGEGEHAELDLKSTIIIYRLDAGMQSLMDSSPNTTLLIQNACFSLVWAAGCVASSEL